MGVIEWGGLECCWVGVSVAGVRRWTDGLGGLDEASESWKLQLREVLAEARVERYFAQACALSEELGVAYFGVILLNAGELADSLGMKRLERARFRGVTEAARRLRIG